MSLYFPYIYSIDHLVYVNYSMKEHLLTSKLQSFLNKSEHILQ